MIIDHKDMTLEDLIVSRLRMKRKQLKIRTADVAERLNVSNQSISCIETGKTKLSMNAFLTMCDMYALDPSKFLSDVIYEYETGTPAMKISYFGDVVGK